jgi:hypothetical protein
MAEEDRPENPSSEGQPAIEHVAGAHGLLKSLQDRIGSHPELAEAIRELEVALSVLTVKTSGLL